MTGKRKKTDPQPILPISLLVAGQPCLVIGGGTIAARKVGHLLDAQADVTVIAPRLCDALAELGAAGRIRHVSRPFAEPDLDGACLVFAATDDDAVNRNVLAGCRRRKILCSAVDSRWTEGDFVMPAICRERGLVVTVATGGQSCLRARVVKDKIADILDSATDDELMNMESRQ